MEAEVGVMWPAAQGHWSPQKLGEARRTLPWGLRREGAPSHRDLGWRPRTRREEILFEACGHSLRPPQEVQELVIKREKSCVCLQP